MMYGKRRVRELESRVSWLEEQHTAMIELMTMMVSKTDELIQQNDQRIAEITKSIDSLYNDSLKRLSEARDRAIGALADKELQERMARERG